MPMFPALGSCILGIVLLIIASLVAPIFGTIAYVASNILTKTFKKNPRRISTSTAVVTTVIVFFITFCGLSYWVFRWSPSPVPDGFDETDLIGTWQATYGTLHTKDTITFRSDGTYQQIFQLPTSDYYYESSWNKWYLEPTDDGRPKLHLEGMRYCAYIIDVCEATGRGEAELYFDPLDDEVVKLADEVVLRITGDQDSPRGIRLWHLQTDPDDGWEHFVFIGD